eukprot:gene40139-49130_t
MGGGSTMMSDEARYRLVRLGRPVATYHDALLQRMVAATLDKKDVLLVFSTTGNVPELLTNCEVAKEYGVKMVGITALGSPLAGMVDVLLPIKALETDFIFKPSSSRYAMMMMLDMLSNCAGSSTHSICIAVAVIANRWETDMTKTEHYQLRCDTLIRNTLLIDGSGSEPFPADVALTDGRITAIAAPGALDGWKAGMVMNAAGNVLSPGFIG